MLFNLFKSNKPIVLSVLPVLGLILWLPSMMEPESISFYKTTFLFTFINSLSGILGQLLALSIIIITSFLLSKTINKSEFFHKNQFLPALIYILITSYLKDLHLQNPILYSNLFLVLAFNRLIKIYRQIPCKNLIFESSSFLLVSALFYTPYIFFFPLPWIALLIIRPFNIKEWLMPLLSLFIFLFYLLIFSLVDSTLFQLKLININVDNFKFMNFRDSIFLYLFFGFIILGTLFSLFKLYRLNTNSTNRFKKLTLELSSLFTLSLILSLYSFLFHTYIIIPLILAVPISLILPFWLFHSEKKWFIELFISLCLICLIVDQYFY